jgi:hypothetical protein
MQEVPRKIYIPAINMMGKIRWARDFDLRLPPPDSVWHLTPGGAQHDRSKCPRVIVHLPAG